MTVNVAQPLSIRRSKMAVNVAKPIVFFEPEAIEKSIVLTCVLPAVGGCEYQGCKSWCFIEQMMAQTGHGEQMSFDEYCSFMEELITGLRARERMIESFTIQGWRAFRDDAWPFTQRLLSFGSRYGVALGVIDTGRDLPKRLPFLNTLAQSVTLYISMDGPRAVQDKRDAGAFDECVEALIEAIRYPRFRDRVFISFTLFRNKADRAIKLIEELPDSVRQHATMVISPYLAMNTDGDLGAPLHTGAEFVEAFGKVRSYAKRVGMRLEIDDEFDQLDLSSDHAALQDVVIRTYTRKRLVRFLPNGAVLAGTRILQQVTEDTPKWLPPAVFVEHVFRDVYE